MRHALSIFLTSICICASLNANNPSPSSPDLRRHIFEATYTLNDIPDGNPGYIKQTYWISTTEIGGQRYIYNWATQGNSRPDLHATEKAAICVKLAEAAVQPHELPKSPNRILTLRYEFKGKPQIKAFPIDRLPSQLAEIFSILFVPVDRTSRFSFIDATLQKTKVSTPPDTAGFGEPSE